MFSDREGRLHMLDYDKKFLLKSYDNLTFDCSSMLGFTAQRERDLRLGIDWSAFLLGPADLVLGPESHGVRRGDRQGWKPFPRMLLSQEFLPRVCTKNTIHLECVNESKASYSRPDASALPRDRTIRIC